MRNPQLAWGGLFLILVGVGLFFYFRYNADGARDPVELMRVVGQIAGAVAGLGLGLIVMSFFVRRRRG